MTSAEGMRRICPCWALTTRSWVISMCAQSVGRNSIVITNSWEAAQAQAALVPHADSVENRKTGKST